MKIFSKSIFCLHFSLYSGFHLMVKIHLKWLEICKNKIRYCSNFIIIIIIIREAQSKLTK